MKRNRKKTTTRKGAKTADGDILHDRPKALRGRDLVYELTRLSVLAEDKRFTAAVEALFDHEIIDRHLNFTRWIPKAYAAKDDKIDKIAIKTINFSVKNGKSVRRACAELAAEWGTPGASFEAARKQMEILYASRK